MTELFARWRARWTDEPRTLLRPLAVVVAVLFVCAASSIGQVRFAQNRNAAAVGKAKATDVVASDGHELPDGGTATTLGSTTDVTDASGRVIPGRGPGGTIAGGGPATSVKGGSSSTVAGGRQLPSWGLKTQGVTDKEVKIGFTYNLTGCGDAGTLSNALGAAVLGDPQKAEKAYISYINDTGGIEGRKLVAIDADDGSGGCPERATAAAKKLVDEDKVFVVVPGFNPVADYAVSKKVPVFGGRDDRATTDKAGAGTFELVEDLDATFEVWASFGKHYLETAQHAPCLVHPDTAEWNDYEKLLVASMTRYGLKFKEIFRYAEDVASAQSQSNTVAVKAKAAGCEQAWFLAYNPIALIFLTSAAENAQWYPTWTFTSFTVLIDSDTIAALMTSNQWKKAVGLSGRVKPGDHRDEGNCARIYQKYYGNDGTENSASVYVFCAQILSLAETMRRAVRKTGQLNADSLLVGADAVTNDFFFDAHVPIDWRFPPPGGKYQQKGWSDWTVVQWNQAAAKYDFPTYPTYWKLMGAGRSGGQDLRPLWKK
jgi:ABC-type branched-subunit amino acid transport system substrate-binding protein